MRGGRREGSGRKPGEKSVVRRVPLGCLVAVDALIDAHRKNVTEINVAFSSPLEPVTEIKDASLDRQKQVTQIKQPKLRPPLTREQIMRLDVKRPLTEEQKEALRGLERLPKSVVKQVRGEFGGTLVRAVLAGIRVSNSSVRLFPDLAVSAKKESA